jgi:hypothetical protein
MKECASVNGLILCGIAELACAINDGKPDNDNHFGSVVVGDGHCTGLAMKPDVMVTCGVPSAPWITSGDPLHMARSHIAVLKRFRDEASAEARRMIDRHITLFCVDITWNQLRRLRMRVGLATLRDGLAASPAAATARLMEQFREAMPGAEGSPGMHFFESDPHKTEAWRPSFCRATWSKLERLNSATTSISGSAR